MTELIAGILVVAAMVAPFVLVAAVTAAFPWLQRGIEEYPHTDLVVGQFFGGIRRGDDGAPARYGLREGYVPVEDRPSWPPVGRSFTVGGN